MCHQSKRVTACFVNSSNLHKSQIIECARFSFTDIHSKVDHIFNYLLTLFEPSDR